MQQQLKVKKQQTESHPQQRLHSPFLTRVTRSDISVFGLKWLEGVSGVAQTWEPGGLAAA